MRHYDARALNRAHLPVLRFTRANTPGAVHAQPIEKKNHSPNVPKCTSLSGKKKSVAHDRDASCHREFSQRRESARFENKIKSHARRPRCGAFAAMHGRERTERTERKRFGGRKNFRVAPASFSFVLCTYPPRRDERIQMERNENWKRGTSTCSVFAHVHESEPTTSAILRLRFRSRIVNVERAPDETKET